MSLCDSKSVFSEMSRMSLASSSSSEGSRDSGYDGPADAFSATNLVSKATCATQRRSANVSGYTCVSGDVCMYLLSPVLIVDPPREGLSQRYLFEEETLQDETV